MLVMNPETRIGTREFSRGRFRHVRIEKPENPNMRNWRVLAIRLKKFTGLLPEIAAQKGLRCATSFQHFLGALDHSRGLAELRVAARAQKTAITQAIPTGRSCLKSTTQYRVPGKVRCCTNGRGLLLNSRFDTPRRQNFGKDTREHLLSIAA